MIQQFKIGNLYIVNNPHNILGIFNGANLQFIPNGTVMLLLDIKQEFFPKNFLVKNRFIYSFWKNEEIWSCNAYCFDFINYFDDVVYD